ncbi:MAG TPA: cytochrome c peroxidase [Kofleriaceae bacterium]
MRMVLGVVALGALVGCSNDDPPPGETLIDDRFTEAQWAVIETLTLVEGPPPNPTNRYADSLAHAAFGQKLFFEKGWAGPLLVDSELGAIGETGKVACITCHVTTAYYTDTRANNKQSVGAAVTGRNAPSLVNVTYYEWGNWAGAHDQMWKQGANGPESRDNFNGNRLQVAHMIYEKYRGDYNAIFPIPLDPALDPMAADAARFPPTGKPKSSSTAPDGAWEMMDPADQHIVNTIMANLGKSLEAYERMLVSRDAPFDRYVAGDYSALSASAKNGLALFIGEAACHGCHEGSTFTDQDFHNTGVLQTAMPQDEGRYLDLPKALNNTFSGSGAYSDDPGAGAAKVAGHTLSDELKGKFRTKSLRHVEKTPPYFHDGSMATLDDVVAFYNAGGHETGFPGTKDALMVPLNLTDQELGDLVEFLVALTGEPVHPALTVDTSAK